MKLYKTKTEDDKIRARDLKTKENWLGVLQLLDKNM
jgi:hypothetical protein